MRGNEGAKRSTPYILRFVLTKKNDYDSKFDDAHGAPIHVGPGESIGITNINKPDWGDPVEVMEGEVCVWWACGVTTQECLKDNGVEFAISHAPGCMFIADVRR